MTLVLIAIGAAVGAPARYLVDRCVQSRHDSVFPWGTFTVNMLGSFLLGLVVGGAGAISPGVTALLGTGLCGALTTYSTFSYETLRLLSTGGRSLAVLNVVASLAGGLGAAFAGFAAATAIWG
ncbi:fluoride efflux transporter CrcB [Actinocatenispora sera]|uniref:Fluoride-specific ion channel FluC n=1 Tax=Actinocatenispora sera TaxID=390989 RepID=A0A810L3V0_9ACTN|nr:fluoride efflux transporter CrcB [Actinocatenispora sera]BCJ30053.1 putative fluoride ion transporter CrcB 2 [Actinocatenispora sera]